MTIICTGGAAAPLLVGLTDWSRAPTPPATPKGGRFCLLLLLFVGVFHPKGSLCQRIRGREKKRASR